LNRFGARAAYAAVLVIERWPSRQRIGVLGLLLARAWPLGTTCPNVGLGRKPMGGCRSERRGVFALLFGYVRRRNAPR
jgi:hypothetical protein